MRGSAGKILLTFCVVGLSVPATCAQSLAENRSCVDRCKQEMKACYRINDVIYIDHCDQQYRQCLAACGHRKRN